MLFTGKGDHGDTTHPASSKRISKTDPVIEALGSVDELNAWIGYCRVKFSETSLRAKRSNPDPILSSRAASRDLDNHTLADVLFQVQQDLFIIQAELVGMKKLEEGKVRNLESWIAAIEQELPPITTFFLPGGTELSSMLDVARTVCRRAERRVVALSERSSLNPHLLAYLNRLSSLLYALTRLVNHRSGILEEAPKY